MGVTTEKGSVAARRFVIVYNPEQELLLIRVIENDCRQTWHQPKESFRPLMAAQHATKHGLVSETNPVTSVQKSVLALRVKPPARFPKVVGSYGEPNLNDATKPDRKGGV